MGESAVLLRSFSHPSDASQEAREGDPIRALTESISFGRFMSESLAWEKWSTFSHNRYLEEVEKFSKPGSVAEKKAYFEAHYKRKVAMKAAVSEESNAAVNDVPALKTTGEIQNNSPMGTESDNMISLLAINQHKEQYMTNKSTDSASGTESAGMSHVVTDEQWKDNSPDTELAHSADANACYSTDIRDDLEDADIERGEAVIGNDVNAENPTQADNLKQLENPDVGKMIKTSHVERMSDKIKDVDQENSASPSKTKQSSFSSNSSSQSGVSRFGSYSAKQVPSLPARNVENIATNSEASVGELNKTKKVFPKFLHKSINFSPRVSETNKASIKNKDRPTPTRSPTRASVNGVSKHHSKLFQSEDKRSKTVVSTSVSGGITENGQFQSLTADGSKSSGINGKKARPACISSPFSFRSKERAAKRKEFFEKLEEKNNAKEAEKGQPETRSKEKGGQNSKKQGQSVGFKAKQNECLHRGSHLPSDHMKKEKIENNIEKLRQSACFKAKPNENSHGGPPSPSNHMKKKLISQPWSPKLGRNPTPTAVQDTMFRPLRWPSVNTEGSKHVLEKNKVIAIRSVTSPPKLVRKPTSNPVQDLNVRPPWRSSMNTASLKHVIEKNSTSTNRSVASLPKKNAHENASPNIQH